MKALQVYLVVANKVLCRRFLRQQISLVPSPSTPQLRMNFTYALGLVTLVGVFKGVVRDGVP